MLKRVPWKKLRSEFQGEWIELVEFNWEWGQAEPSWATVRHHASDRRELMVKVDRSGARPDSVILFVGYSESAIRVDANPLTVF